MDREDMLSEISNDWVTNAYDLAQNEEYDLLHEWLHPLFRNYLDQYSDTELIVLYNELLND